MVVRHAIVAGSFSLIAYPGAFAKDLSVLEAPRQAAPVGTMRAAERNGAPGTFLMRSSDVSLPEIASRGAEPCPTEGPLAYWTGSGDVVCPCFAEGERAGVIFEAPAEHYPIEILSVGIGWGSLLGGSPATVEESILIYDGVPPNPGFPIEELLAPQMVDGFINVFDLEPLPGQVVINDGAFLVALEIFNANAGMTTAPTVVHDGNGCTPGRNSVYAFTPGGQWLDACALGVTGDWLFQIEYRPLSCDTEPCPADVSMDGQVDFSDLNIVLGFFGQSGPLVAGDTDGDQDVDFSDLNTVLAAFGTSCR